MSARPETQEFSRDAFDSMLRHRFFYAPSFEIYGGVSGLYDYGPAGCALQANIVDTWKRHFIIEEDMQEVDCTALTPYEVLKTSGHVDKFSDYMVKDTKTGEIFRADHLIEEVLESRLKGDKEARGETVTTKESDDKKKRKKKVKGHQVIKLDDEVVAEYERLLAQIDNFNGEELGKIIIDHKIVSPSSGAELAPPVEFNLMFDTSIGPSGTLKGFLRPETAQGQFVNFNKLLECNNGKMPFASASVGKSFRNEISPRAGLLRVREFLQAEIEHYVDPLNKKHVRFHEIADLKINCLPRDVQMSGSTETTNISIGEAVKIGMIENETLGYFVGRIYLFLLKIGVDPKRVRFRQHMDHEMAHYASDCWDAELESSYGWVECVGCADRSAYDLTVHSARTKEKLCVRQALPEPEVVTKWEIDIDKKKFGPKFRKDAGKVEEWLTERTECELEDLAKELTEKAKIDCYVDGVGSVEIDGSLVNIEQRQKTEHVREYTPNVIEPSFGIGRILYSLLEHSYWSRPEDSSRGVLSLKPAVAPTKVLVVPLSNNPEFVPFTNKVTRALRIDGLTAKVDESGVSIGRRYARNDEVGTPFGITIDFQTIKDNTVTIRERDSTEQVRGSIDEVVAAIKDIVQKGISWEEGTKHLAKFDQQES